MPRRRRPPDPGRRCSVPSRSSIRASYPCPQGSRGALERRAHPRLGSGRPRPGATVRCPMPPHPDAALRLEPFHGVRYAPTSISQPSPPRRTTSSTTRRAGSDARGRAQRGPPRPPRGHRPPASGRRPLDPRRLAGRRHVCASTTGPALYVYEQADAAVVRQRGLIGAFGAARPGRPCGAAARGRHARPGGGPRSAEQAIEARPGADLAPVRRRRPGASAVVAEARRTTTRWSTP